MSAVDAQRLQAIGKPIKGPSALGGSFKRFMTLTWTLAYLDFKLKFFGSVLGYLWQLMKPLLLFGVFYTVFTQLVRIGGSDVDHYPVVLLSGIVMYLFWAEATTASVACVIDRENLVRKIHFPRLVIPLATNLTCLLNFLLNLLAVIIFVLASGIAIRLAWLELVPIIVFLAAYCVGLGLILSANFPRLRDLRPIWEVVVMATFYASPILYPIEVVQDKSRTAAELIVMLNPLATVVVQVRHTLIDPSVPSAAEVAGGGLRLLVPVLVVALLCAVGFWTFDRQAPRVAEDL